MTTPTLAEPAAVEETVARRKRRNDPLTDLQKKLRSGSTTLSSGELRFLVDMYYSFQYYRTHSAEQLRASVSSGEQPHEQIEWVFEQTHDHENQIKSLLESYVLSEPLGIGRWLMDVYGIGPVIAAGLLAHIDINKAPTVGHIWAYAGLDPTRKWERKTKRPWNARLKVICWKASDSFMKFHNRPECYYGHIYAARKELEQSRNEQGLFKEQAEAALTAKSFRKDTEAYKWYTQGKLPPGHIDARARRYAVKLFLAHFWQRYRELSGLPVPLPYPIAKLDNHTHFIPPPH